MSGPGAVRRTSLFLGRMIRVWRVLPYERRLAAGAAMTLFLSLFLPWYQKTATVIASAKTPKLLSASGSVSGWGAFSFVEAAVLLVAVGVVTLVFQRGEGRAFHLPGGDGWVVTVAGGWTCCLVVWRIFDRQGTDSHGQFATTWGIEWGIFIALVVAGVLTYAGNLIRAAHVPEPPLPGDRAIGPGVIARPSEARDGIIDVEATDVTRVTAPRSIDTTDDEADAPPPRPRVRRAPAPGSPRPARRGAGERPVGWLTAPRETPGADDSTAPTRAARASAKPPAPWSYREEVADSEAETISAPARRRRQAPPDDQLTIKLDHDDSPPSRER